MQVQPTETFGIARFLLLEKTVLTLNANIEKLIHVSADHGERLRELYEKLYHSASKIELASSLGNTRVTLQKFQNKLEEQIAENQQRERDYLLSVISGKLGDYVKRTSSDAEHERIHHQFAFLTEFVSETDKKCKSFADDLVTTNRESEVSAEIASELKLKVSALEKTNAQLTALLKQLEVNGYSGMRSDRGGGGGGGGGGGESGGASTTRIKELRMAGLLPLTGSDPSLRTGSRRSSLDHGASRSALRSGHGHGHGTSSKAHLHSSRHGKHESKANLHGQPSKNNLHGQSSKANLRSQNSKASLRGQPSNSSLHGSQSNRRGSQSQSQSDRRGTHSYGNEHQEQAPRDHDQSLKNTLLSPQFQALVQAHEQAQLEAAASGETESLSSPEATPAPSFLVIVEENEEVNEMIEAKSPFAVATATATAAVDSAQDSNEPFQLGSMEEEEEVEDEEKKEKEKEKDHSNPVDQVAPSISNDIEPPTAIASEISAVHTNIVASEESSSSSEIKTSLGASQLFGGSMDMSDMEFTMPEGVLLASGTRSRSASYASITDSINGSGSYSGDGSMDSFELLRDEVFAAQDDMRARLLAVEAAMGGGTHRTDDLERRNDKMHDALGLLDAEHSALLAAHKAGIQERAVAEASIYATLEHLVSVSSVLQGELTRHETQLQILSRKLDQSLMGAAAVAAAAGSENSISEVEDRGGMRIRGGSGLGGIDTPPRGQLNVISEKEERLLDGFATHQLTLPALGSMKELLSGLPGVSGTPLIRAGHADGGALLEFGGSLAIDDELEPGSFSGAAGRGSISLRSEDLARLKTDLLLEVEQMPVVSGVNVRVEAATAQLQELDASMRHLRTEQGKMSLVQSATQQELGILRKIVRAHSLTLAKRRVQETNTPLPVAELGDARWSMDANSVNVAANKGALVPRGLCISKPAQNFKLPETVVASNVKLAEQKSDPRLTQDNTGDADPATHPVPPPAKSPSRIRQAFERRMVAKPKKEDGALITTSTTTSPIKYLGDRLWAHVLDVEAATDGLLAPGSLNSEDAVDRYIEQYGCFPEEREL